MRRIPRKIFGFVEDFVPAMRRAIATVQIELQLLGKVTGRRLAAATADVVGKALSKTRIVRQKVEPLALHRAAGALSHTPHLEFQDDTELATRQVSGTPDPPAVS